MAAAILAQLQQHPVISNPRQRELAFSDGGKGALVSCVVQSEGGSVRQYVVLRVHGGRACSATLTAPADSGRETAQAMMTCLSSLRPD